MAPQDIKKPVTHQCNLTTCYTTMNTVTENPAVEVYSLIMYFNCYDFLFGHMGPFREYIYIYIYIYISTSNTQRAAANITTAYLIFFLFILLIPKIHSK